MILSMLLSLQMALAVPVAPMLTNESGLKLFQTTYTSSTSLKDYLEKIKGEISPELYNLLKAKTSGLEDTELPKFLKRGGQEFELVSPVGSLGSKKIGFKIQSVKEGKYLINGTPVTIAQTDNPETIWKKVSAPLSPKTVFNSLLLEKAQAVVPLALLVAPAIFAGAVGVFGGTVSCFSVGRAVDECQKGKADLEAYDWKRRLGDKYEVDESNAHYIRRRYQEAISIKDSWVTKMTVGCPAKQELVTCLESSKEYARKLNFDLEVASPTVGEIERARR